MHNEIKREINNNKMIDERMRHEINTNIINDSYYFVGQMTALSNRFQKVADRFFSDITWKQCFILICIKICKEAPTINELSALVGTSHQNAKQLLIKLERAGYIEFVKDEKDKRKQKIVRTKKADEFDEKHNETTKICMEQLFKEVDMEKIHTTVETMIKIEDNLKEMDV